MLVPVRLNDALVEGTLINSGSSLSMVLASTLAALPVPSSIEPFTSRAPNIVDMFGSALQVLGYVVAAVAVFDVEVAHRLVVISELAFPLLISINILKPHCTIIELGPPDVVRLGNDRYSECVEKAKSFTLNHDVAAAVVSVLSDTTLHRHAASREQVHLPIGVLGDSTFFVMPLQSGLASTACAVPQAA